MNNEKQIIISKRKMRKLIIAESKKVRKKYVWLRAMIYGNPGIRRSTLLWRSHLKVEEFDIFIDTMLSRSEIIDAKSNNDRGTRYYPINGPMEIVDSAEMKAIKALFAEYDDKVK